MKREFRYVIVFLILLALLRLSLVLPHRDIEPASLLNVALQLLLCFMCIDIAIHSYKEQRHVYILFALFFSFSLLLFASSFVGKSLFRESVYASIYYHVYANKFGLNFVLLLAIVFALVDYFITHQKAFAKYTVSLALTMLILLPLYSLFLSNPLQLYYEEDYIALGKISEVHKTYEITHAQQPSQQELVDLLMAKSSQEGDNRMDRATAELSVARLRPYTEEGGSTMIFWKPLNLNSIYVQIIIICLLGVFFISNYFYNKPHSAYLDKIFFLFLLLSLMEIIHVFAYISSSTLAMYRAIFTIAQYVTVACLLIMVYTYDLRLRFVLSPIGEYYEETLRSSPGKVTRWRDEWDNLILKLFFNFAKYNKHLGHYNDQQGKK